MLILKQLTTFLKNTSQLLTGHRDNSANPPLASKTVDDPLLHSSGSSQEEYHLIPEQDKSPSVLATAGSNYLQSTTPSDADGKEQFSRKDETGEQKKTQPDNSPASTARERLAAAKLTCQQLEKLTRSLNNLCRESDPLFVNVGRDLAIVTRDVRKLTETVHHAVSLLHNDQGKESSLQRTEELVQSVFAALTEKKDSIGHSALQVEDLVTQIFQCQRIKEIIDHINTLFRIVRINIRIQCSARGLNEEMFEGVSEDLDHLSKTLHQLTKQILHDMDQGTKSLVKLQKAVSEHIKNIDSVFEQTQTIVSRAFYNIRQLMHGTDTMIRSADTISKKVSDKVGEVVVSIQFHDSLSQRVEHILQAFEDISKLCGNESGEITDEHLGTSFIILDLQQRQLVQIRNEIRLVRSRIDSDFLAIESEVAGLGSILHDTQFRQVGPQQFLGTLFSSLEDTLTQLNFLLAEGDGMLQQIEKTASETSTISNNLMELKENVSEIREETRVQAVNTIIMAGNLGQQGKTIEVLAKEIQTLSDKSGVLADYVESMQLAVYNTVEELIANTTRKENHTHIGNLTEEIHSIKKSFSQILGVVSEITEQIEISASHIKTTRAALVFLDSLESLLDSCVLNINRTRDQLESWKDQGTHDSEEIELLIKRYSMAQERMIHMFDRVDAAQDSGDEDDVFF